MKILNIKFLIVIGILCTCISCDDYIDIEPKGKSLITQIADLEKMLLNSERFSTNRTHEAVFMTDDVYAFSNDVSPFGEFGAIGTSHAAALMFKDYLFNESDYTFTAYSGAYEAINYTNIILEHVDGVEGSTSEKDEVKGKALVFRASNLLELVNMYAKHYSPDYADEENSGIVIPLNSREDYTLKRSTLNEVYTYILRDLEEAVDLLPTNTKYIDQPTEQAAYGYLARTYLLMGNWAKAEENASLALGIQNTLYDYKNEISVSWSGSNLPHASVFNNDKEAISFEIAGKAYSSTANIQASDDLLATYETGDIRRSFLFSAGTNTFIGRYGLYAGFWPAYRINTGITVPEMYLIRAEANARSGKESLALADLNTLRENRFSAADYADLTDENMALTYVKNERRREMALSQWRLVDIKRYNLLDNDNISASHYNTVSETTFTLNPGNNNWVLPIPRRAIEESEIVQNDRDGNI
jgi:hypothetical protein